MPTSNLYRVTFGQHLSKKTPWAKEHLTRGEVENMYPDLNLRIFSTMHLHTVVFIRTIGTIDFSTTITREGED